MEGRCDVCFGIPTSPAVIAADKDPVGIRWLDMNSDEDPDGAARCVFSHAHGDQNVGLRDLPR